MLTSIKLFVVLTVVTCVIAYWSDNLGKKLGKKRISLLGFRPRQTATAITMASSWGIMILTLLILVLLDRNARRALLRYEDINAQVQDLSTRLPLLQLQNQKFVREAKDLKQQNAKSKQLVKATQEQLQGAKQQLGSIKGALGAAQAKLATAQSGETEARQGEAASKQGEAQAQQRIAQAQNLLTTRQQQLTHTQARLTEVNSSLSNAKLLLASTNTQLQRTRAAVQATMRGTKIAMQGVRELTQKEVDLRQRVKEQQATVSDLEEQRKTLEGKVQELQVAAQDAQAAASRYYRQAGEWFATSRELSNNKIIVAVNQLLSAQTIPANVTTSQALTALHQIVAAANAKVQQPPIGAQVMHLAPLNIDSGGQRVQLSEDEILNHLADYITTFEVPVSVRLMAAYNQVEGEKEIAGRLMVVPVQPVFKADEPITDPITIDGTQGDARIFNQLLNLISEGEKAARAKGVMPPVSPDNPNFYAVGTNERIFEALRRIQAVKGPARVRLLTTDNLNTVEPLRVRIEVSRFEVSRP